MDSKITYTSQIFKNQDGTLKQFLIPAVALKTYIARDTAVAKIMALGGTHAPLTEEVSKLMATVQRSRRKIQRQGWYSIGV